MVSCRQCNTHNSLDSAFCKKCGATMSPEDIEIAREKLAAMIADGNKLFADGRTEDAMMVADTAVATDPTSAAALSLKGMCFERNGQLAEALDCFERVVALNPDSTLDKLKVNDLKNMMVVEKFEVAHQGPNRRVAIMGAVAASLLVVAVGAIVARANATSTKTVDPNLVAMNDTPSVRTFGEVMSQPNSTQTNPQANTVQQPSAVDQAPIGDVPSLNGYAQSNRSNREEIRLPRVNGSSLPNANESNSQNPFVNNTIEPVRPNISGNIGIGSQTNAKPPKSIDPDPQDTNTNLGGNEANTGAQTEPKSDPGIYEIEVSKGGTKSAGGNDAGSSANGRQALTAAARSQFMQGNYTAAANSYERALRMGADQGSTNQRLGQCYAHLGRTSDAVAAYTRAAASFEKSGNAQAAEACRQAIKVLGGN